MTHQTAKRIGRSQPGGWAKHLRPHGKKVANRRTRRAARAQCHR